MRLNLLGCAESLANFGLFPQATISEIREGLGNLDVAKDLIALAALFNSNWERVINKVPFDRELVLRASVVGTQLLRALGSREVGEVRLNTSMDWEVLRARTFRLLVNTYEILRRATAYVRWYESDAATFTPSLHNQKPKRTRPESQGPETPEPGAPEPEAQADRPIPSTDQTALGAEPVPTTVVESGLRGAPPFIQ
jgi:hypothetical protein